jgi:hypothetical protein
MAETFQFSESNTGSETVHDGITNLNFGSNDSQNLNTTTYPITRGQSSFEKYIRAKFTGSFTTISNMLFWASVLSYVTGETIKCAYNVSFVTPSASANGDSNVPITSGGSAAIQSFEGASTIVIGSGISGYTKYLRLQLQTTGSTPSGAVNQKTFTFQYDVV